MFNVNTNIFIEKKKKNKIQIFINNFLCLFTGMLKL